MFSFPLRLSKHTFRCKVNRQTQHTLFIAKFFRENTNAKFVREQTNTANTLLVAKFVRENTNIANPLFSVESLLENRKNRCNKKPDWSKSTFQ